MAIPSLAQNLQMDKPLRRCRATTCDQNSRRDARDVVRMRAAFCLHARILTPVRNGIQMGFMQRTFLGCAA